MTVMLMIDLLGAMGGAERSLYLLAKGLKVRGHRVIVCCLKGGELSGKMRKDGFLVEDLNVRRIYDFNGLKALFRAVKIARKERVSAVVSYHESSDFIGIWLALLTGIPIVSSRRDTGFNLKSRHIWLYRVINRFFDHIATVSVAVKEAIVKAQWSRPSDIMVIHNGVNSFTNEDEHQGSIERLNGIELNDGCLKICSLANIRPIKGQKYLIDAAGLVVRRHPKVRFFLVGSTFSDDSYSAEIEEQVRALGLEKVINFTGEFPRSEVPTMLAAMDISVSSSLTEGMSNALLESMAVGKPVVATAVGGNPELVEDGKTGYLVPLGDSQSMAEALLKLLTNPELRHNMGLHARSRVEHEFSVHRMVERYEDLLQYVYLRKKHTRWVGLRSRLTKMTQNLRSWFKILIASIIYYSGLIVVFQSVKRTFHLGRVKILCFHDVSEMAEGRSHFSIFMWPESFVRFLEFLIRNYHVVSLEEAIHLLETGQSLKDDVFALTFDDCYKGWTNHVLPACQRFQVPHAIFVATGPVDTGRPLLYDGLIFLAENTWRKVIDLSPWGLGVFFLDTSESIARFVENVHEYWRGKSKEDRNHFFQELSEYLGVSLNSEKFKDIVLDWDDVREMDTHGVTIGAHSVNHTCLRDLAEAECFWEIKQSKQRLEKELGHSVSFFAYPYGAHDYFERDTIRIVAAAGFRNAFTLDVSDSNQLRPFEIGRRGVSRGMFVRPDGKFNESLLATELCGLGDLLFRRLSMRRKHWEFFTYE